MGCPLVAASAMVLSFRDSRRVYNGYFGEQDHGVECVGLFESAVSTYGADLSAFCDHIFRVVCGGNYSERVSDALSLWREETSFSCALT